MVLLLLTIHHAPRAFLSLPFRNPHSEPVERIGDLDLAGEARIRPHVIAEVEHVLFHRRGTADLLAPGVFYIDVAGRAGAGTAALGLDARHSVLDRAFHHGRADLGVDRVLGAVRFD